MKREIKFRGKDLDTKTWSYGDYWHDTLRDYEDSRFDEEREMVDLSEVDPDTIGQYTGLQDKNGKDIYEGDIVALDGQTCPYPIVFKYSAFILGGNEWLSGTPIWKFRDSYTVIGNIHDDQKLLSK